MTLGTKLANTSYLSVANPPSRDSGMTIAGWVFVPAGSYNGFHNIWSIHYSGNNVSECVQFQASDSDNAVLMVIDYPPYFETISTKNFANGKWWYFAYVWSNDGGTITKTTYWSDTPGSSLTSVDSRVVTSHIGENPDSFDIGAAQGWDRYLRGTIQYVGLWETALSLEQLAEQSISKTPVTSSWVFISGENGDYTDKSGNARTVTTTGTVSMSDVGVEFPISPGMFFEYIKPTIPQIDWSNPITKGLVFAWKGDPSYRCLNLVDGTIGTTASNLDTEIDVYGNIGTKFNGDVSLTYAINFGAYPPTSRLNNSPCSFIGRAKSITRYNLLFASHSDVNINSGWQFGETSYQSAIGQGVALNLVKNTNTTRAIGFEPELGKLEIYAATSPGSIDGTGSALHIYRNGIEGINGWIKPGSDGQYNPTTNLLIGGFNFSPTGCTDATLYDILIFNRELSQDEIIQLNDPNIIYKKSSLNTFAFGSEIISENTGIITANAGAPTANITGDTTTRTTGIITVNAGAPTADIIGVVETSISPGMFFEYIKPTIPQIDWSNPITKGLVFAWKGDPSYRCLNLVDGTIGTATNNLTTEVDEQGNIGTKFAGGNYADSCIDFGGYLPTNNLHVGPATWVYRAILRNNGICIAGQSDQNGSHGWNLGFISDTLPALALVLPSNAYIAVSFEARAQVNTSLLTVAMVHSGRSGNTIPVENLQTYLNGVKDIIPFVGGSTNATIDSNINPLLVGSTHYTPPSSGTSTVFDLLIFNRELSPLEINQLLNPNIVYKKPSLNTFAFGSEIISENTGIVNSNAGAPVASIEGTSGTSISTGVVTVNAGAPVANITGITEELSTDIICYGNSVTAGYGISNPSLHYPEQLAILLGSRIGQVTKLGYSGQTTATLLDQFEERVLPFVRTDHPTIVIFQEGFNSAHYGVDAATILSEMWATCVKCHDNNLKVIVQDISKADADSQSHEDTCLIVNAGLVENWTTYADGFVGLRDFFYNPLDPIMYQSDGAHFTAVGLHVLAEINYSEVNRLLLGDSYTTIGITTANTGDPTASIAGDAVHTTGIITANTGSPVASVIGDAVHTTGIVTANAGAPVTSIIGNSETSISTGIITANTGSPIASITGDAVHTTGIITANIGGAISSLVGDAVHTTGTVIANLGAPVANIE